MDTSRAQYHVVRGERPVRIAALAAMETVVCNTSSPLKCMQQKSVTCTTTRVGLRPRTLSLYMIAINLAVMLRIRAPKPRRGETRRIYSCGWTKKTAMLAAMLCTKIRRAQTGPGPRARPRLRRDRPQHFAQAADATPRPGAGEQHSAAKGAPYACSRTAHAPLPPSPPPTHPPSTHTKATSARLPASPFDRFWKRASWVRRVLTSAARLQALHGNAVTGARATDMNAISLESGGMPRRGGHAPSVHPPKRCSGHILNGAATPSS